MIFPDYVMFETEESTHTFAAGHLLRRDDVEIHLEEAEDALHVTLAAEQTPVRFLQLRWNRIMPVSALYLGDAWERTYGDCQWRSMDPARVMPWYFLCSDRDAMQGFGVKVNPGSFAGWSVDPKGISLWLDVRNGGRGVVLSGRSVLLAEVISEESLGISAFAFARNFCRRMCASPLLPPFPVYGGNNWYYAYGNSSEEEILKDSEALHSLCEGNANKPFMILDDGWQTAYDPEHGINAGPWDRGNSRFPDMAALAGKMKQFDVRPGIWFRPLWNQAAPKEWILDYGAKRYMDPSRLEVLELVCADVRRFAFWGYEMVKYDFSSVDIFDRYGMAMNPFPAGRWGWTFHDRTRTSAEIVRNFYQAIHQAAGSMLLLGCNTIGHLAAGHIHLSRTGDDTSGKSWERTRKMGVNTLAFRMCQHRIFFDCDADCIGILSGRIPWERNAQWGRLLSRSGTAFFASIQPGSLTEEETQTMKQFFRDASLQNFDAQPLDWQENTCPEHWSINGMREDFSWYCPEGNDLNF